jgi:hypothetical protein
MIGVNSMTATDPDQLYVVCLWLQIPGFNGHLSPPVTIYLLMWHKIERHRINAVPQTGWRRPVGKNMSLMPAATGTFYFRTIHSVTAVCFVGNTIFRNRFPKRRPAGAGVKFSIGGKQGKSTTSADVGAPFVVIPKVAGKRPLGAFLPQHIKLFFCELFFPGFVRQR